jgi:hypothetical protein
VHGTSYSGYGVYTSGSGHGVFGHSAFGYGVHGHSNSGYAGYFEGPKNYFEGNVGIGTDSPYSKLEVEASTGGPTIFAKHAGHGVHGTSYSGYGVYTSGSGHGVFGHSAFGYGVHGHSNGGYAGYFEGPKNYFEGKVGIGMTSPAEMLHINKPSGSLGLRVSSDAPSYQYMNFGATDGYSIGRASDDKFFINRDAPLGSGVLRVLTVQSDGKVGVGTTSPSEKLDVDGTARLRGISAQTGATYVHVDGNGKLWKITSSKKYKTNIRDLEDDPHAVLQLRPVKYQCKTTGQQDVGLLAEEVHEVLTDLVIYDTEGRPEAVKYDRVALYLLGIVKSQEKKIAALEQRLEVLETTVQKDRLSFAR